MASQVNGRSGSYSQLWLNGERSAAPSLCNYNRSAQTDGDPFYARAEHGGTHDSPL